jgi:hypothetical protein
MPLIRINSHPAPRQLLVFSLGCLCFAGAVAVYQWVHGRQTVAAICGGVALLVPLIGLFSREGLRGLYLGLCYATYPLGYVISAVVLVALFYGVVTPLGLLLRLFRHDPLAKRPAPADRSYWQPRDKAHDPSSYFKQY